MAYRKLRQIEHIDTTCNPLDAQCKLLEFVSITEVSRDARSYVEVLERRSHSVLWANPVFCVPRTSFSPMLGKVALFVGLYFLYKLVSTIFEWCRVHYISFTKLPAGPPAKNILLGNLLEATTKDFHRTHQEWADTYGGIYPYRALWIHVRSLRMACLVPSIPGIFLHCMAFTRPHVRFIEVFEDKLMRIICNHLISRVLAGHLYS